MLWGKEEEVTARFAAAGVAAEDVAFSREPWRFTQEGPPAALLDQFTRYYGPTMNAVEAAEAAGRGDALHADLLEVFESQNTSEDPTVTSVTATFLRVTVAVR